MNWKQALILGGAVLVLAACADATAPSPGLKQVKGRAAASSKVGTGAQTMTTQTACSGYSLTSGRDQDGTCGVQ